MKYFLCYTFLLFVILSVCFGEFLNYENHGNNLNLTHHKLWALLIAGSNSWYNYRHQADICHSYQVLHNHGIPDERIVVMMYDDIANNSQNPTPGIIINHVNGSDVYKGVPRDYTGDDVTPETFMSVLKGDKEALKGVGSGKVINSGPNDHVFVYFSDHGAPGIIAFPDSELTAKQLNNTINYMHKQKKYNKLVLYIEACESGSMFDDILLNNINVFATTAANPNESSYACYYDTQRETYLGDVYSVNWLEDSDKENLQQETLSKQFKIVKQETTDSHVMEYGDLSIGKLHVSEFQGKKPAPPITYPKVADDSVRSRDVPLYIVKQKLSAAATLEEYLKLKKTLDKMLRNRYFLSDKVYSLLDVMSSKDKGIMDLWTKHLSVKDFECYDEVRRHFQEECFAISKNPYALDFMYVLVNLCEYGVSQDVQKAAMDQVCTHPPVYGIH